MIPARNPKGLRVSIIGAGMAAASLAFEFSQQGAVSSVQMYAPHPPGHGASASALAYL